MWITRVGGHRRQPVLNINSLSVIFFSTCVELGSGVRFKVYYGLLVNLKRTFCANKVIVVQMSSISATGSLLTSSLAGDETFANHYKS